MTGFEVIREFPAAMAGREGAWRFIRGFAAAWGSPPAVGDGWSEPELDATEARLGVRLPVALREAYGLFGRRTDLVGVQDVLLGPDELHIVDKALVFRVESQGAARWGIPLAELERPDPPVMIRLDLADKASESWDGWLDRFSHACVEMVLSESLVSPEELADGRELDDDEGGVLEGRFTRLPLPDYPTSQAAPGIRWYAGRDVIIRDDGAMIQVRARTVEALDRVRAELPGEWTTRFG
jgi:hypothetical protein